MPKKLLLDTSIIIDFLRSREKADTLLYKLSLEDTLCISLITHTELFAGRSVWERADARSEIEIIFNGLEILPLNEVISKEAGQIKADNGIDLIDAIIAATAKYNNLQLVTLNIKDFKQIRGLNLFTA